jgi:ornithine decarboxylase
MFWLEKFPRIEPFYALKSNYDFLVYKLLDYLGAGFDCSSIGEIEMLMKHKIKPEKIIYANPNKDVVHISYSYKCGVKRLVFDNELELVKISKHHLNAECLLRVKVDCLPSRFGADFKSSIELVKKAIELKVNLIGICFYVGFRQKTAFNIIKAIKDSRILFDYVYEHFNYIMHVLDIGGGFPGTWQTLPLVAQMANEINLTLNEYFPCDLIQKSYQLDSNKTIKIIAELGTFYTTSAFNLCLKVISKKEFILDESESEKYFPDELNVISGKENSLVSDPKPENIEIDRTKKIHYCVNDSIHSSFKWYNLNEGLPVYLNQRKKRDNTYYLSSITGATCDSGDFIVRDCLMQELDLNEYLIFRNMGSYTKTSASNFNFVASPESYYVSRNMWDIFKCAYSEITDLPEDCQNMNEKENSLDKLFN